MADRWAVATGNWSNTATWDGGTLPQAGDDVYADGKTVTINQDINVASIRNTQRSGGTAGGLFATSGTRTITANLIQGAANLLTVNADLTINGNVNGGTGGVQGCVVVATNITSLIINGNVIGGSGSGGRGIHSDRSENTIITGNLTGGSASGAEGYLINFGGGAIAGSIAITGNVIGGSSSAIATQSGGTNKPITITGNVTGGVAAAINLVASSSGGITVTGVVTGGANGIGVLVASGAAANIDITGNCLGSASGSGAAVACSGSGRVRVIGDIYGGSGSAGVNLSSANGINRISGSLYSSSTGYLPVSSGGGRVVIDNSTTRTITARADNAGAVGAEFAYSTDANLPATNNVRLGTTYGAGGLQVGTLVVPPAGSVAFGVPVDNTTGTAVLTESGLLTLLQSTLTPSVPYMVERSTNDTNPITFSWPVSGATITGEKSINNGAYSAVAGAITFLRTESNRHYYALAYNAGDRSSSESSVRYKMTDGTYTKYFVLKVNPPGITQPEIRTAVGLATANLDTQLASLATASSINEIKGVGWDSSTDTLEKIRDAAGNIVITPLQAVADQMVKGTRVEVSLGYTGTVGPIVVTDASNNPVNITAPSEIIISKKWRGDILVIPDGSITRSGANNNQFSFSASGATLIPGEHAWALRRLSDKFVFAKGDWAVKQVATKD